MVQCWWLGSAADVVVGCLVQGIEVYMMVGTVAVVGVAGSAAETSGSCLDDQGFVDD